MTQKSLVLLLALSLALPGAASAVDYFLNIPGDSAFRGPGGENIWMQVADLGYSLDGIGKPMALLNTPPANASGSLTGGDVWIKWVDKSSAALLSPGGAMQITKELDRSSVPLLSRRSFPSMKLALCSPGEEPEVFMTFTLKNVDIEDAAGGKLGLNFEKIDFMYTPIK